MVNNKKISISILIMITASILCVSLAGTVNANIAPSDNNSTIIIPSNDDSLIFGHLFVLANQTTANVNDTVSIIDTVDNLGMINWQNVLVYIPIPKGLEYLSYSLPYKDTSYYNPATGIWSINSNLGRADIIIIETKVLPEASGQTINISSKIQQLMISNSTEDKSSLIPPSRTGILTINNQTGNNGNSNGTITVAGKYINPTAKADIKSGLYNTNKIVTLLMNKAGNIYYTTNGKIPTKNNTKYTKPIKITVTTLLKFIAIDNTSTISPTYTMKYTIDKIPPNVETTTPNSNANKISITTPITIKFSENILTGSNYNNIYIKNLNTGKMVYITKNLTKNIFTIKQIKSRLHHDTYFIYLPKGAFKDQAGNPSEAYQYKFTTE